MSNNILNSSEGNEFIREKIIKGIPFIASKMGDVEQRVVWAFLNKVGYDLTTREMASNNAGIVPNDDITLNYFAEEFIKGIQNTDILGLMNSVNESKIISQLNNNIIRSELRFLEPFYFDNPWSEMLENKKVLIIHPFESSILSQFNQKDKLFLNKKILPDFKLLTIKSSQTNGGGLPDSKPFIESLFLMKEKIDKLNFDVSIIGCGAYGLLLANHIKNMGKQSIHIGGGLQILFGIKGRRWDVHPEISSMYNDYWIRPNGNEKTLNYNIVEGGTYW